MVVELFQHKQAGRSNLGVDPHHDGIMLKPALVVADGGVIHRDVFSQYGPMASWVHALWVVLGEFLGVLVAWKFVARPFKEYTDRYDSITVMDYLETRFGDHEHIFRLVGTIIILSMVTAYTAAQLTASGKAFNSFLGMDYATGVTVGAVVILFYTTVGGFKAVAYSDLLQGILMFGCLFLLPVAGIMAVGGWDSFIENLHLQDPALLTVMGSEGLELSSVLSAVGFVAIGFAFLGSPQLLTRFMAARSQVDIVQGSRIAIPCILALPGLANKICLPTIYPYKMASKPAAIIRLSVPIIY